MAIPLDLSSMQDFASDNVITWCDGCGDYGVLTATKEALVELGIPPHQVVLCYDVGCCGNMSDKLQGYRAHGLHGRVISFAAGAAMANPNIPVIAYGGDGASFSEGIGHFVHGIRSNYDMTFVLHNNGNYGLTTGQASATTWQGEAMNSSPNAIPERTLQSMDFVFSLNPTFVARTFSGDIPQMKRIMQAAIKHRGFAIVDILQACPTYNKFMTHGWLLEHVYDVQEEGHDTSDFAKAREIAVNTKDRISTGILYQNEAEPAFYERLVPRAERKTTAVEEVEIQDVTELMRKFI